MAMILWQVRACSYPGHRMRLLIAARITPHLQSLRRPPAIPSSPVIHYLELLLEMVCRSMNCLLQMVCSRHRRSFKLDKLSILVSPVPHLLHPLATNTWWETRLWISHTQTKSLPTLTIINKHCLMHRWLLEPRFEKWSKPRQAPWGLILVWHWHMLRLSPVSTLQPFLLQTRSDRCRLSRHQVSGLLSL